MAAELKTGYTLFGGLGYVQYKVHGPTWEVSTEPYTEGEVWWSAKDMRYANYDPWAEYEQPSGSHLVIELTAHKFLHRTPKGAWLALHGYNRAKRFLNFSWTKQWASPTQREALQHLAARKRKHVAMCKVRLGQAEQHLDAVAALCGKLVREENAEVNANA